MSDFVRNSPWLKYAFPPSVAPDAGPGRISQDVQLGADYFGGGYATREKNQWHSTVSPVAVAIGNGTLIAAMPTAQLTRVLGVSIFPVSNVPVVDWVFKMFLWNPALTQTVQIGGRPDDTDRSGNKQPR